MRKLKKLLLFLGLLITIVGVYIYSQFYNYYERGSKDHFKINIGESFTVKFHENHTAQSKQCWTNEQACTHISNTENFYTPRMFSVGCDGCGGFTSLTFTGRKIGIDTIILSYCPPEYWNNGVKDTYVPMINENGALIKDEEEYTPEKVVDYEFIVEVIE